MHEARARIPRAVVLLGFVSLLMDLGTELAHSLLPGLLVGTLGASVVLVGLIDGVAETTASLLKVVSGVWSDRLGRRKPLAVAGYGLSALVRPLFALAATPAQVLGARFLDRVGKGLRGPPRDALLTDVTPPELRGAAFGLRQSLDTVGAIGGPLLATALMWVFHGEIRTVLGFATVPAVLAVSLLAFGVREPVQHQPGKARASLSPRGMGGRFGWVVAAAVLVGLARYGEAFLLVRAGEAGLDAGTAPLALAWMNLIYALSSWPAGVLSDRIGRVGLLTVGVLTLGLANGALALAAGPAPLFLGVGLFGLHMGLTSGLMASLVADAAPPERRGTAFGLYHLAAGLTALPASLICGALWESYGAPTALGASTAIALLGLPILLGLHRRASA